MVLFFTIFVSACTAVQPKSETVDIAFARSLAVKAAEGSSEEWAQIDNQIESMGTADLAELKKKLLEALAQDPPVTTSMAETWLIYGIIYQIDDELGTLDYSTIVEGAFNWDRATSLFGTTELDFITDGGQQIPIFTTVATVDRDSAYLNSDGRRVRLYIKEEVLGGGRKRNNVVKIETLY